MTGKGLRRFAVTGLLVVLAVAGGKADGEKGSRLSGIINDHTLAKLGSWEMHGRWSMEVDERTSSAEFTAEMTMERADLFFTPPPVGTGADANNLTVRNAHTHHIAVTDGLVTTISGGFRVTGAATIAGNGAKPPFGTNSTLQIDVTGGELVPYSNIALTFSGDAVEHFGDQPISGAVRTWR